jgi:hypothetical protein
VQNYSLSRKQLVTMESKQVVKNNENGKQKYIAKLVGFSRQSFRMT